VASRDVVRCSAGVVRHESTRDGERVGMAVKLLMTWDIVEGREQEYFEFVIREFVPGMQKLGIRPTEAWYTTYGQRPQILTGGMTDNLQVMQDALSTDDWERLKDKLMEFVTNFDLKVIQATGGFQL
jgi:hypothetical protein